MVDGLDLRGTGSHSKDDLVGTGRVDLVDESWPETDGVGKDDGPQVEVVEERSCTVVDVGEEDS